MSSLYPHEVKRIVAGAGTASGFAGFFFPSLRARGLGEEKPTPPYSAIVYKEGDEVRAEDWKGRKIASGESGVDDTSVIQSALDIGGKTIIMEGEYSLTKYIQIYKKGSTLEGLGCVLLHAPSEDSAIRVGTGEFQTNTGAVIIRNLWIEGGYRTIWIDHADNGPVLDRVSVRDSQGPALYIDGWWCNRWAGVFRCDFVGNPEDNEGVIHFAKGADNNHMTFKDVGLKCWSADQYAIYADEGIDAGNNLFDHIQVEKGKVFIRAFTGGVGDLEFRKSTFKGEVIIDQYKSSEGYEVPHFSFKFIDCDFNRGFLGGGFFKGCYFVGVTFARAFLCTSCRFAPKDSPYDGALIRVDGSALSPTRLIWQGIIDKPWIGTHQRIRYLLQVGSSARYIRFTNAFVGNFNPNDEFPDAYLFELSSANQGKLTLFVGNLILQAGNYDDITNDWSKLNLITHLIEDVKTKNSDTAAFSGDGSTTQFAIAHGLVAEPSKIQVTPMTEDAAGDFYVTKDSTNIYVNYLSPPPSGSNNVKLSWCAEI